MTANLFEFLFIVLFFSALNSGVYTQTIYKDIDSLKLILEVSEGKNKVDLLNQLSQKYYYTDKVKLLKLARSTLNLADSLNYNFGKAEALTNLSYGYYLNHNQDSSLYYAKEAMQFVRKKKLESVKARILNLLGLISWKKSDLNSAINFYNNSLFISKQNGDSLEFAKSLNYLGLVYWIQAKYSRAIESFIESLKLKEQLGNKNEIIISLNNLARVFNELGNQKQSIDYSSKALKLAETIKDQYSLARALNNLGRSYYLLNKYKIALGYLTKAVTIKEEVKDSVGLAYVLNDMANCYNKIGKLDEAKQYFDNALRLREKVDGPFAIAYSLIQLAKLNLKMNQFNVMSKNLKKGMNLAAKSNANELLMDGYKTYSAYYEKVEDFKNALKYHQKYDELKNYIFNEDANKRIAEMQVKYDTDKKEKENELLKKENEITNLELAHQTNIVKFVIAIAVLGLILFLVIYRMYRGRQKANNLLRGKNKEVELANTKLEEKNKLILKHQIKLADTLDELKKEVFERQKYAQELIKAKDKAEEANRLKSEFLAGISHEIRTPINTILNYVSLLKEDLIDENKTEFLEYFEAIQIGSRRLIRTIDSILNMSQFQSGEFEVFKENIDLYKDVLLGIFKEFKQHADQKGLELQLTNNVKNSSVWADQYTLSQLFSNLIDNAIKYTNSGKIQISILNKDTDNIYVEIEDTGIGISQKFLPSLFEPFQQEEMGYSRAFEGNGLGLALVKKYIEINKGMIEVKSKKGRGTKFFISLPRKRIEILHDN